MRGLVVFLDGDFSMHTWLDRKSQYSNILGFLALIKSALISVRSELSKWVKVPICNHLDKSFAIL